MASDGAGRRMKETWINLTIEQREEFQRIIPTVGWRILLGSELPSVLPDGLRSKTRSILVFSQPTLTGGTHLIVSAKRVDSPAKTIEIEPLGLIVCPTATGPIGVFVYDGHWVGRLERPPAQFWEQVARCGIVSKLLEGTQAQLPNSHRRAIEEVIQQVRAREDSSTMSSW